MKPFDILSSKIILETPWINVEKQRVLLPNGEEGDWYISKNADAVIIVPVLTSGQILLQKNYKHGCGEIILEFCAGMIDDGESAEQCAHRELLEETGYQAQEIIKLGEMFSNPTGSKMKYHIFAAKNCEKVSEPELEAAEQIELFPCKMGEAEKLLFSEEISTSAASVAAFYYFQRYTPITPYLTTGLSESGYRQEKTKK